MPNYYSGCFFYIFVVSTEPGRPTCTRSEWTCDNGDCIPIDGHCNGRVECSDRSDERNCKHSNKSFQLDRFGQPESRQCEQTTTNLK